MIGHSGELTAAVCADSTQPHWSVSVHKFTQTAKSSMSATDTAQVGGWKGRTKPAANTSVAWRGSVNWGNGGHVLV